MNLEMKHIKAFARLDEEQKGKRMRIFFNVPFADTSESGISARVKEHPLSFISADGTYLGLIREILKHDVPYESQVNGEKAYIRLDEIMKTVLKDEFSTDDPDDILQKMNVSSRLDFGSGDQDLNAMLIAFEEQLQGDITDMFGYAVNQIERYIRQGNFDADLEIKIS